MERQEIILELKEYFAIEELVCRHVFTHWGERSFQFLSTELLETLLILRKDVIRVPIMINNYVDKGTFTQRGLRCNLCQLVADKTKKSVLYMSSHNIGKAIDFDAQGLTAEATRNIIMHHIDEFPLPIRLEKDVSWVHLDVLDYGDGSKINLFTA